MSIGSNIKKLREAKGVSQLELANSIGVTDKAVSAWEIDYRVPRMQYLQKIADYFSVSKSLIIDDSESNEVKSIINLQEKCLDKFMCSRSDGKGKKESFEIRYFEKNVVAFRNGIQCDFFEVFFDLDEEDRNKIVLSLLKKYC